MKCHPFTPERLVGVIYHVEGSFADVSFSGATELPRSHFGEHLGRGEVGQFVVIDVGGKAVFGRLLRVGSSPQGIDSITQRSKRVPVEGRIQLLATLHLDSSATRGILKYPKVGDPVYAASGETTLAVVGSAAGESKLTLGRLSVDETVEVAVPLARLFGRHLAVVGATGSGKSWTLGHLAESVNQLQGKMILIDGTGEFRTLGNRAQHLAFGTVDGEPAETKLVGIPHYMMRESDRNAFLNPSSGTQVPKLREAIRTLRLAYAIKKDSTADADHTALVADDGTLNKQGLKVARFGSATRKYASVIEDPHAPFDIKLVGKQIQWECVWPTDRNNQDQYGAMDYTQIGYVSTLVSRVNDLLQTSEIMQVIDPRPDAGNAIEEMKAWINDPDSHVLRISLRNLTFANHLREIIVNVLGQSLLATARRGVFAGSPLVVAVDEAHQFFDVTVGDEFSNTRLSAFDSIAKEGRKYGLTVCVATQRPGDLPAGILSQVGMTIVHRLADGRDRQRVEQAAAELDHSATRLLPGLVPGEAILMGVDFPVPVSVRVNAPVAPPASDGPKYSSWGAS